MMCYTSAADPMMLYNTKTTKLYAEFPQIILNLSLLAGTG